MRRDARGALGKGRRIALGVAAVAVELWVVGALAASCKTTTNTVTDVVVVCADASKDATMDGQCVIVVATTSSSKSSTGAGGNGGSGGMSCGEPGDPCKGSSCCEGELCQGGECCLAEGQIPNIPQECCSGMVDPEVGDCVDADGGPDGGTCAKPGGLCKGDGDCCSGGACVSDGEGSSSCCQKDGELAADYECCSGFTNGNSVCAELDGGACRQLLHSCSFGVGCCYGNACGFQLGKGRVCCVQDGDTPPAGDGKYCCSGAADDTGTCFTPDAGNCGGTAGALCGDNSACCADLHLVCNNGTCAACSDATGFCESNSECCGSLVCQGNECCVPDFFASTGGAYQCCSGKIDSQSQICQPADAGACAPTGSDCQADPSQCCDGACGEAGNFEDLCCSGPKTACTGSGSTKSCCDYPANLFGSPGNGVTGFDCINGQCCVPTSAAMEGPLCRTAADCCDPGVPCTLTNYGDMCCKPGGSPCSVDSECCNVSPGPWSYGCDPLQKICCSGAGTICDKNTICCPPYTCQFTGGLGYCEM